MNRVLYFLFGACFAGMIALAFFESRDIGQMGPKDIQAVIGFCLMLAAGAYILIWSPWGRAWRQRFDRKTIDAEDRARTNIRSNGEVPPPRSS